MQRDKGPVWYAPYPLPSKDSSPAQRQHCEARPSSQWGQGLRNGHRVQSGSRGRQVSLAGLSRAPRSQNKPGLPPMSVLQRRRGVWGQLGSSHLSLPAPSCQVRDWLCIWALGKWPEAWQLPEPMLGHSHLNLVILLSIGKLKGVCLHRAGHGGPAACLGCPPLFIQALPRGPSLGRHLHQLPSSIYLGVVAVVPATTTACSPVPARGRGSRCTRTLSHWVDPRLSHWAQPSGHPIRVASTG